MKNVRTSLLKVSIAIAVVGVALTSAAQKAAELDYVIRFAGPISHVQEKYIHEVLRGQGSDPGVWVDTQNREVKVRTHASLDRVALDAQWNAQGLQILELTRISGELSTERVGSSTQADTFPRFIDTGNPATDNATYAAAKEAWIAAHSKEGSSIPSIHPE